ncbi:MAG: pseudouridine synthase [Candidatus Omnitrophota bacterium]
MRLQVFLSRAGICSRRAAKELIKKYCVKINGITVCDPSFKINPEQDKVFFKDKEITLKEKIYVVLNKPKGVTTTKKDPFAKKTVIDLLPKDLKHLNPCGRLDKDTTGLLIMTNDGDFLNRITHPRFNIDKSYIAKINKPLVYKDARTIEKGVRLEEGLTAPCKIMIREKDLIEVTIHEGRKRQIKRIFKKLGYSVLDLKRVREGFLTLGGLREGKWRFIKRKEIEKYFSMHLD